MKNEEIRKAMKSKGLKQWELAELLGVSEQTMYRKLRTELPKEEKQKILEVINSFRK